MISDSEYHRAIRTILAQNAYQNQDVSVIIDTVFCGTWLWEEVSKTHVHFLTREILEFLGASLELAEYLKSRPVLETSWKFINPKRLRAELVG